VRSVLSYAPAVISELDTSTTSKSRPRTTPTATSSTRLICHPTPPSPRPSPPFTRLHQARTDLQVSPMAKPATSTDVDNSRPVARASNFWSARAERTSPSARSIGQSRSPTRAIAARESQLARVGKQWSDSRVLLDRYRALSKQGCVGGLCSTAQAVCAVLEDDLCSTRRRSVQHCTGAGTRVPIGRSGA